MKAKEMAQHRSVLEREHSMVRRIRLNAFISPPSTRKAFAQTVRRQIEYFPPFKHNSSPILQACEYNIQWDFLSFDSQFAAAALHLDNTHTQNVFTSKFFMSYARRHIILWPFSPAITRISDAFFHIFND